MNCIMDYAVSTYRQHFKEEEQMHVSNHVVTHSVTFYNFSVSKACIVVQLISLLGIFHVRVWQVFFGSQSTALPWRIVTQLCCQVLISALCQKGPGEYDVCLPHLRVLLRMKGVLVLLFMYWHSRIKLTVKQKWIYFVGYQTLRSRTTLLNPQYGICSTVSLVQLSYC